MTMLQGTLITASMSNRLCVHTCRIVSAVRYHVPRATASGSTSGEYNNLPYLEESKVLQLVLQVGQRVHAGQDAPGPHAHVEQRVHARGEAPTGGPGATSSHLLHLCLQLHLHNLRWIRCGIDELLARSNNLLSKILPLD